MGNGTTDYLDALHSIPCSQLDYAGWVKVGMACKAAGLPCEAWEEWSNADPDRFNPGECARKWDGFNAEQADGIGPGTLVHIARQYGWNGSATARAYQPPIVEKTRAHISPTPALDLDALPAAACTPTDEEPAEQLREYATVLFTGAGGLVNVVLNHDENGKPRGWGHALALQDLLENADDLLAHVDATTGAWVRINPVCDAETLEAMQEARANGGEKPRKAYCDDHVTAYRYALIEADPEGADAMTAAELEADKARQLDLITRLQLPCAAIVDSGRKSVHAIVRVDAADPKEYKERVERLHAFCNANGLKCDAADKNPSRMSRLPGAMRGDHLQRLIATNAGAPSWDAWREWVDAAPRKNDEGRDVDGGTTDATPRRRRPTQADLVTLMRTDRDVMGAFGTNELDGSVYITGPLPWDMLGERRRWQDADAEHLFMWAQSKAGTQSRRDVAGAFTIVAAEHRFNPIAQALDALPEWDGTARADYLLWALLGCEGTDYTRAVSHTFMRGAVLRGYRPGSKFDYVLTLIGPQGCGKSTAVARMAMLPEFLCESVSDLTDHKMTAEQTQGKWICELAELEGMTGRRLTGVKQSLTMTHTTVRLAYARNPIDLPRSCVFVATTNEGMFLADPTGARRFLPVRCAVADRKGWQTATEQQLQAFVLQAWAEVVHEYKAALALPSEKFAEAFPVWLTADMEHAADEEREAATIENTDVGAINAWLLDAAHMGCRRVCARQVAIEALGMDMSRSQSRRAIAEVSRILTTCCPGWHYVGKQRVNGYGTCRAWDYTEPTAEG